MTRPLSRYLVFFALIYIGFTILFAVISTFIASAGNSGSIIAPFLSAIIVGEMFIKRENRAPNDQERSRLTWGSLGVIAFLTLIFLGIAFFTGAFADLSLEGNGLNLILANLVIALLIIGLIMFFMMRWAYGSLTRKRAEKLLGDQNSTFD